MIENCINQYNQASADCDVMANCLSSWFNCSANNQENSSYTSTARRTALIYLSSGVCCLIGSQTLAPICFLPGAIVITSSEVPTCGICVIHACRRTCFPPKDLTRPMSMSDRQSVAVKLENITKN